MTPGLRSYYDHTRMAPKLWQGGAPPEGMALRQAGFDVLVMAAGEHLRPPERFPGVKVIHVELDDSGVPMKETEWQDAQATAQAVAHELRKGKRVLVTCWQGKNRSGLVTALTIWMMSDEPGAKIVEHIQRTRPGALSNRWFVGALSALPGRAVKVKRGRRR